MLFGVCLAASAAVTYCSPSAFGYGASATGGGSATPVLVGSVSELQSALNKGKNKVIIITKSLTFTTIMKVQDGANVTLLGLPGVTLTSLQQNKDNSGILYVKRFNNLIIRNLTFVGPGAYDCDGSDLLCFENVTNAWVDHCDFQDGCDGNFDNKNGTDNVTVSWCRFRYLKAPKAGGSGGSDDHRFTNLLGSSSSDKPGDGTYNLTWAYCWWDNGCKERMVRCRNCELHFLNCYWNSSVANYYVGPENAKCYFEGCTFEGKANTKDKIFKSYGGTNACKFVDCAGNLPSNSGSISAPGYSYTASAQAETKSAVTNATCGAGATLTVTTAGAVSSTCDSGTPLPTVYTVTWDAATNGGSCGTATSSVTSGNAIGSLPEASKASETFDGWYTAASGGTKITASTTVTGDVTYYAQFTTTAVTTYRTVIWDANGGSCATESSTVEDGQAVGTLPDASKSGSTFDGWYTAMNGGTKITTATIITADVTYYAHYTATGGGGGGSCETKTIGFTTATCAKSASSGGERTLSNVANLTVEHELISTTSGAIAEYGNADKDMQYDSSTKVYSRGGYKWNTNTGSTIGTTNNTVGFSVTVGSGYEFTVDSISFGIAASANMVYQIIIYQAGDTLYQSPERTLSRGASNYDFHVGDLSSSTKLQKLTGTFYVRVRLAFNSTGKYLFFPMFQVIGDLCPVGGATPTPANFVLTYDENGGSGTMADEEQTGSSVTVDANGFTAPTGYEFLQWNGSMNGGGTEYTVGQELTLTEDLTIYAIWQPKSYTVTLDAAGGTDGSASVEATFDAAMPSITVPTREGYIFQGYYTGADGAGTQYYDQNGSSTNAWTTAAATTLHAYWVAGSTPDATGCNLHFWFIKAADATTNSLTNDATVFSGMVADASDKSGSITIDGTSYSVTRRSGDNATFGSFTIPSGKTGVFYALAVSSGSGDRQINLVCGGNVYELPVAGGSDSYKRIESEELPAGTYSIEREGSSNVRIGVVVVKICESLPSSAAPTISGQPVGATYCNGEPVAALTVNATGSGTVTYQWQKDGVAIAGATSSGYTPTASGIYRCVVTNTEDGKAPASLTSDEAEVVIHGAIAAPTISQTGNTVNMSSTTSGAVIYYTTDGTDPTTGSLSGTSVSIVADCTVKAYAVKDGCESAIESFDATFDPTVKECAVLITYTLPGSGTATPTIPADENNLVGGSADYKVGSNSISGGYKLESNQYFGLTLASGQFKAGDKVTVTITKASDQGDLGLHLSASKTGAAVSSIAAGDVVVGENVFTLTADCDAIYVARNSSCNQNPYVKSISVCRTLTKYTVTFDKNNVLATGTMGTQSFYDGFAAKLTANSFSLTDYEFAGWATDPSGSKVYDDKQSVTMTGNSTLYAIWEPAKYTLTNTVNPAGYGTVDVASVDDITPGTTTTSNANTYTVNGTTVTATPAATTAEYTYAFDSWSGLPATVTADATVTANFTRTARTYSVTLNTNGGTVNAGNVTSYTYGTGATLPTDVSKSGADFGGWYDNSSLSGSAVAEVSGTDTGDKEYWAKWIVCPAPNSGETIYRFDVNSSVSDGSICSSGNNPVQLTTPTQLSTLIGGTLEGWISSGTSWNNLAFTGGRITYNNGDRGVLVITLDCPIHEGDLIRFNNYSSSNSKYNYLRHTSYNTSDDQLTLNASRSETEIQQVVATAAYDGKTELFIVPGARTTGISYFEIIRPIVITLDANTNGGKVGGENTQLLYSVSGGTLALPHATKDGFRFKGWYDAPSGGNAAANPYTVSTAATLYAQFEDCPTDGLLYKFEVRTDLETGNFAETGTFDFNAGNYLTALTGGTLAGYEGNNNHYISKENGTGIRISDNSGYLKVDLDCALEEGDVFKSTISDNSVYVTSSPSRTSTAVLPKGTLTQTPVPAALVGAKTLYIWRGGGNTRIQYFEITRPKLTQITLSATEAYNKYTTSVVATYGEAMPEIATLPVRTGYIFSGYYTGTGGTGTQYYDGMGYSVRNWDIDAQETTLYAYWITPCEAAPTLEKVAPVVTIWNGKETDLSLVKLSCNYDTTDIHYSLQSASENIPGCTYFYVDERIYIKGVPALGNTSTEIKTITFTMTNDCSPASTYTVDATIHIYPASQKPKIAFIITGTKGGAFDAYNSDNASSCSDLVTYLSSYYNITYVNGYATKDATVIENYYKDYDLMVVTDFLDTGEGYTNALGAMIDKKPILSFEAFVADQSNWHIGSNPKDPSPKVQDMKILCAGHAIFENAKYDPGDAAETVVVRADTTVNVLSSLSSAGKAKGLQGFTINEAPDFIFLATVRDADNNRDLIVCCERQVVFPARLLLYGINFYEMGNLSNPGKIIMKQMIDYLLMTDESKVADCSLVFDNKDGNKRWDNPKNWAPGYNIVPTPYHPTRIIAECHVYTEDAHAGSVKVNTGRDGGGHPVDGKLIIEPTGGLTVAGLVMKVNDTRYASPITIKAEDLLIKADANHSGAFVYGNKESDVRATVEYYSRGSASNTANPVWQYMGVPFQAGQTAIRMYYEAWMCRWVEGSTDGLGGLWQWVDINDVLVPFEGYCITQEAAKTYTNAGKLNPPVTQTIALDNRDGDGFAFAANSWTAPIKIQEMQDADFTNAEKAIYIYHSGTYDSWETNKETIINTQNDGATPVPGQYAVIPIHSSPYIGADSVIPAMQGFFVKTTAADAQLSLVYNRVVYDAKYFKTSTQPMRAPRREADDRPDVMVLRVAGDTYSDRVHILSQAGFTDEYEDGWDGRKIAGDDAAPMLAVVKGEDIMAVAAVATADEHYLSFRAGEDSVYTFAFDYQGETIYLYDLLTAEATEIKTGNTYTFEATNRTPEQRFLITKNPPRMPTGTENTELSGETDGSVCKILLNDRIYIIRGNEIHDVTGKKVSQPQRKEGRQ